MTHRYPLHAEVPATCDCCSLTYRMKFTSKFDHVLCRTCRVHLGSSQEVTARRNVEHVRSWSMYADHLKTRYQADLETQHASADALRKQVEKRDETILELRANNKALTEEMERVLVESLEGPAREPNERVLNLLAGTVAEQATVEKETAFRMRDYAMGRLWAVDEIHHSDDENNGHCTCGQQDRHCSVLDALAPIRNALYKWEIKQVERFRKDLSHGLPPEHPEIKRKQKTYRKIG